jgi:hypothetical protein
MLMLALWNLTPSLVVCTLVVFNDNKPGTEKKKKSRDKYIPSAVAISSSAFCSHSVLVLCNLQTTQQLTS